MLYRKSALLLYTVLVKFPYMAYAIVNNTLHLPRKNKKSPTEKTVKDERKFRGTTLIPALSERAPYRIRKPIKNPSYILCHLRKHTRRKILFGKASPHLFCALSGPFDSLYPTRFSASQALCTVIYCLYLRVNGFFDRKSISPRLDFVKRFTEFLIFYQRAY